LARGFIDGSVERLVVGDVNYLAARIQSGIAKALRLALDPLPMDVEHGDPRAVGSVGLGQSQADAAGTSGYHRAVAGHVEQLSNLLHARAPQVAAFRFSSSRSAGVPV